MSISFYVPRDTYGYLSNFSSHGVEFEGVYWPTVEHFFQAAKFEGMDAEYQRLILRTKTPKDAAELGRSRRHPIRTDWESVKEEVMLRALRKKFETHLAIREQLLATGDEELVEASPMDFYWGVGNDGSGQNRLGILLMQVRSDLRQVG
ncbi:MAG: NADAR family protein [Patescibacteria group bacterium]